MTRFRGSLRAVSAALLFLCLSAAAGAPAGARKRSLGLVPQTGLGGMTHGFRFSHDGRLLATAGEDGVKLWSTRTGELVDTLEGEGYPATSAVFSRDGRTLVAGYGHGVVRLWDVRTGSPLRTLAGRGAISNQCATAVSPRGDLVASAERYEGVSVWDIRTGRRVRTLASGSNQISSLAFSPDGAMLVASTWGRVAAWKTRDWTPALRLSSENGTPTLAFAGPATLVIGEDAGFRFWDVKAGRQTRLLPSDGESGDRLAVPAPGGRLILVTPYYGSGSGIPAYRAVLWTPGRPARPIPGLDSMGSAELALSPDGTLLAAWEKDGIRLRHFPTGRPLHLLRSRPDVRPTLTWSPDRPLVAVSEGRLIRIWDLERTALVRTLQGHEEQVRHLAFARQGILASGAGDYEGDPAVLNGELMLWDAGTGRRLFSQHEAIARPVDIAVSADGERLAAADVTGRAGVWDTRGKGRIWSAQPHVGSLRRVHLSPDGKTVVTFGHGRSPGKGPGPEELMFWQVESSAALASYGPSAHPVGFRPDGSFTFFGGEYAGGIYFVRPEDNWSAGQFRPRAMEGLPDFQPTQLSADGKTLLCEDGHGYVALQEAERRVNRARFTLSAPARKLALSPDARYLATVAADGAVRVCDATTGRVRLVLRALGGGEWLAMTGSGYYHGSSGAQRHLRWRSPAALSVLPGSHPAAAAFRSPERVRSWKKG